LAIDDVVFICNWRLLTDSELLETLNREA
jgi:hypothetical protein